MTLVSAGITLLLILDPFGNLAVFQSILARVPARRRWRVLAREAFFAYVILMGFLLAGGPVLDFLGLQGATLSLAGGIMLFIIAIAMVFPRHPGPVLAEGEDEPFLVPLATPLIAGPGGMAFLLLLARKEPGRLPEWMLAVTVSCIVVAAILIAGDPLIRLLGPRGIRSIERLMGMILCLIAVQMVLNGFGLYWETLR